MRKQTAKSFWDKVAIVDDEDSCWPWLGYCHPKGYGRFSWHGKMELSHRRAWVLEHGPISDDIKVLHSCDNRPCCRPKHLFLGTDKDNSDDKLAKGRGVWLSGEQVGLSKLTEIAVIEIRQSELSNRKLGPIYKVSHRTISLIRSGKTWKHIKDDSHV